MEGGVAIGQEAPLCHEYNPSHTSVADEGQVIASNDNVEVEQEVVADRQSPFHDGSADQKMSYAFVVSMQNHFWSGNVRDKKHWDLAGSYDVYWICWQHLMLVQDF